MKKYTLTNGREITVLEDEMKGMAGESMTILTVADHNNNMISLKSVSDLLTKKDSDGIDRWNAELGEQNYNSAVSWCK